MQLDSADTQRYTAVTNDLRTALLAYLPPLRALAAPALDQLLSGEFCQLAALLPAWLADLLPLDPPTQHRLGVAGLWLWWYASALDDTLDGGPPAALPAAQQALLAALEAYRALGLADTPAWAVLQHTALLSANAYAVELQATAPDLRELQPAQLVAFTPTMLMDRAAPFGFVAVAQLALSPAAPPAGLSRDLPLALRRLTAARQIADDAADWIDDLRLGRLNYVSAAMIRAVLAESPASQSQLSLPWLVGNQLELAAFWEDLEREHAAHCAAAADLLAPYGPSRLADLIAHQRRNDADAWARLRRQRGLTRTLFGLA